jgi:hypothetical protein
VRGRGAGCSRQWSLPFIGVRGASDRRQCAVTDGVKALMPSLALED